MFVASSAWNNSTYRLNCKLKEEDLTANNLQSEINLDATILGFIMEKDFYSKRLSHSFNEGCCDVIINNGTIKYK